MQLPFADGASDRLPRFEKQQRERNANCLDSAVGERLSRLI